MDVEACGEGESTEAEADRESTGSAFGRSWTHASVSTPIFVIPCGYHEGRDFDRAADHQSDQREATADRERQACESSSERPSDTPFWALQGKERQDEARKLREEAKEHNRQMREHLKNTAEQAGNRRMGTAGREFATAVIEGFQEDRANAHARELEVFPEGRPGRDMDEHAKATK